MASSENAGTAHHPRLMAREFLRHLRSQSLPELVDRKWLAALEHVEAQYGEKECFVSGLEVRLGSPERYADYVICTTDDSFPGAAVWLEMDYQAFSGPGTIRPCLFLNTWESVKAADPARYWNRILDAFAGEHRAQSLREGFFAVLGELPRDACVKQIGSMARPGEADSLRVVMLFEDWEKIPKTLEAIGWGGDAQALAACLAPYADMDRMAVNIDIDPAGVRQKTGIEAYPRWRHPVLVDRMVSRLEEAGLCREDKGRALRRWVRTPPGDDPFIQALISHFKFNYADGKITEAKAYLEQSPFPKHRFFPGGKELPSPMRTDSPA